MKKTLWLVQASTKTKKKQVLATVHRRRMFFLWQPGPRSPRKPWNQEEVQDQFTISLDFGIAMFFTYKRICHKHHFLYIFLPTSTKSTDSIGTLLNLESIGRLKMLWIYDSHSFSSLSKTLNSPVLRKMTSEALSFVLCNYKMWKRMMSNLNSYVGFLHRGHSHRGFIAFVIRSK